MCRTTVRKERNLPHGLKSAGYSSSYSYTNAKTPYCQMNLNTWQLTSIKTSTIYLTILTDKCKYRLRCHSDKTKSCMASANACQDVMFKRCVVLVMPWDAQGLKAGGGCEVSALVVEPPIRSRIWPGWSVQLVLLWSRFKWWLVIRINSQLWH